MERNVKRRTKIRKDRKVLFNGESLGGLGVTKRIQQVTGRHAKGCESPGFQKRGKRKGGRKRGSKKFPEFCSPRRFFLGWGKWVQ